MRLGMKSANIECAEEKDRAGSKRKKREGEEWVLPAPAMEARERDECGERGTP